MFFELMLATGGNLRYFKYSLVKNRATDEFETGGQIKEIEV